MSDRMVMVELGDDVWINFTELAAVEPYRDIWGAVDINGGTVAWLKSGEKVRVRNHSVAEVLELWQDAIHKIGQAQA